MSYVPLHVYSEYSFLKSGLTLDKYFSFAKKHNFKCLGICDYQVMFGFPIFFEKCNELGIKPILGMDVKLGRFLLSIFIKNEEGYLNLIKISNAIQNNTFSYNDITSNQSGLVFVLSVNTNNILEIKPSIERLNKDLTDFYIGLEIYNPSELETIKINLNDINVKTIIYPFIRYLKKEDAIVLDIVDAIKNSSTLNYQTKNGVNYLHTFEEINEIYKDLNIIFYEEFINQFNFNLKKNRGVMLQLFGELEAKETIKEKCLEGLKRKNKNNDKYLSRLEYELSVIDKMGFNNYFLIVSDYVNYAKTHDILVGPGRGSAAGSLVSYALDITTPDPIEYDLYFERFLNPSRNTMPDIDIDFEDIKREDVISYLKEKYGKNRVANIVTFQTIAAKQALRDIGRVFNIDNFDINYLSKALGPFPISFKNAYKQNQAFRDLIDKEPYYLKVVRLASKIEGLIRQSSLHAAGVVLNNTPIENSLPVSKDENGNIVTQYEMTYLEQQGFLKMDILALRNLTIIKDICNLKTVNINPYNIPINDKEAIDVIKNNLTMGLFQLESAGMRRSIEILKPSSFDDVAALIALFRPGPMDNIPLYANRKNGLEKVSYIDDKVKAILSSTYGIIVYQEQIMKLATSVAGLSLAEADSFRKSISKKDISKMESLKQTFINGAIKNGYTLDSANKIYETIEKFASYGFNKAHSISYAYICVEMAYLKAHFPLEFYATILEHESGFASEKMYQYLKEIKSQNITLLAPNINESGETFRPFNGKLLFPLTAIKGLQSRIVDQILLERNANGKFTSLFDFVSRLYKYEVKEATIMALIDAGAFDEFNSRATLRASIANAINQATFNNSLDVSLLTSGDFGLHFDYIEKDDDKMLNLEREYEVLGLMISDSPLKYQQDKLLKYHAVSVKKAKSSRSACSIGLILIRSKIIKTKKGEQMAYLSTTDGEDDLEVTLFPSEFSKYWNMLKTNNVVIIKGYFDRKKEDSFVASEIMKLED